MILAGFADRDEMMHAAGRLREGGLLAETYSPLPPSEDDRSPVPLIMLLCGLLGAFGAFAMQAYATTAGYRIDVGGRPDLFWPAYIPFAFETGVLSAMLSGLIGYLIVNRLPTLYDPIDESDAFRGAMRDGWFVAIRGDTSRAPELLHQLHPAYVEEIAD